MQKIHLYRYTDNHCLDITIVDVLPYLLHESFLFSSSISNYRHLEFLSLNPSGCVSKTIGRVLGFFFLIFILFIFLYSRFLLVIYFIHISVYMSIPVSQGGFFKYNPNFPPKYPSQLVYSSQDPIKDHAFHVVVVCLLSLSKSRTALPPTPPFCFSYDINFVKSSGCLPCSIVHLQEDFVQL